MGTTFGWLAKERDRQYNQPEWVSSIVWHPERSWSGAITPLCQDEPDHDASWTWHLSPVETSGLTLRPDNKWMDGYYNIETSVRMCKNVWRLLLTACRMRAVISSSRQNKTNKTCDHFGRGGDCEMLMVYFWKTCERVTLCLAQCCQSVTKRLHYKGCWTEHPALKHRFQSPLQQWMGTAMCAFFGHLSHHWQWGFN